MASENTEWLDETGDYPTDAALERIETWPHTDLAGCLDFARSLWHWDDWCGEELRPAEKTLVDWEPGDRFARFATGGWSGNESIIHALNRNTLMRAICWQLSKRGGLHIYQYR